MSVTYQLVLHDFDGSNELELPVPSALEYQYNFDTPSPISFQLSGRREADVVTENLQLGRRHYSLYRDSVKVHAGTLVDEDVTFPNPNPTFQGLDWLWDLDGRYVRPPDILDYFGGGVWDVWDIAWDIITYTQTWHTLGLTRGMAGESGRNHLGVFREYGWWDRRSILQLLTEIANIEKRRFWFRVSPNKVWLTYLRVFPTPERSVATINGKTGSTMVLSSVSRHRTWGDSATDIVATGGGEGEDMKWKISTNETAAADAGYRTAFIAQRDGTFDDGVLQDAADFNADRRAHDRVALTPVVFDHKHVDFDSVMPGSVNTVLLDQGYFQLTDNDAWWCISKNVKWTGGIEVATATYDPKWTIEDSEEG